MLRLVTDWWIPTPLPEHACRCRYQLRHRGFHSPAVLFLELEGVDNGWYKITYSGKTGYVSSDLYHHYH